MDKFLWVSCYSVGAFVCACCLKQLTYCRGRHQRAEALRRLTGELGEAGVECNKEEFDSELGVLLVLQWAWGFRSAPSIQQEAQKSWNDMKALCKRFGVDASVHGSKTLRQLAALGTFGQ